MRVYSHRWKYDNTTAVKLMTHSNIIFGTVYYLDGSPLVVFRRGTIAAALAKIDATGLELRRIREILGTTLFDKARETRRSDMWDEVNSLIRDCMIASMDAMLTEGTK